MNRLRRGDVYYANLNPVVGSEQGGIRPVLVLQNDVGNCFSSTTIVAPITSNLKKPKLPTHVMLSASALGIEKDSIVLLEQLRTVDRRRLKEKVCSLDAGTMRSVEKALYASLDLGEGIADPD